MMVHGMVQWLVQWRQQLLQGSPWDPPSASAAPPHLAQHHWSCPGWRQSAGGGPRTTSYWCEHRATTKKGAVPLWVLCFSPKKNSQLGTCQNHHCFNQRNQPLLWWRLAFPPLCFAERWQLTALRVPIVTVLDSWGVFRNMLTVYPRLPMVFTMLN